MEDVSLEETGRQLFAEGELPVDPILLVKRLGRTAEGCLWLRDRWLELLERLEAGREWRLEEMLRFVRLMGKEPQAAIDNPALNEIFLAFDWLTAGGGRAFWEACREEAVREGNLFAQWMR
jgi:hypothetical protein